MPNVMHFDQDYFVFVDCFGQFIYKKTKNIAKIARASKKATVATVMVCSFK